MSFTISSSFYSFIHLDVEESSEELVDSASDFADVSADDYADDLAGGLADDLAGALAEGLADGFLELELAPEPTPLIYALISD